AQSLERGWRDETRGCHRLPRELADVERRRPCRGRGVDVPHVKRRAADQQYGCDHDERPAHASCHGASAYSEHEVVITRKLSKMRPSRLAWTKVQFPPHREKRSPSLRGPA